MALDANALFARAEAAFRARQFSSARDDLLVLRENVGDHPAVLHLLGLVERRLGNLTESREVLERACVRAPHDSQIANNLGNVLADLGEDEAALAAYDRALALRPGFAEARLNRANRLRALGRTSDARGDLEVILAANPQWAGAWSALGSVARQEGQLAAAVQAFERALALEPAHRPALIGRGQVALERGEGEAARFFMAAEAAQPDDAQAAIGLSEALEAAGDPGFGIDTVQHAEPVRRAGLAQRQLCHALRALSALLGDRLAPCAWLTGSLNAGLGESHGGNHRLSREPGRRSFQTSACSSG